MKFQSVIGSEATMENPVYGISLETTDSDDHYDQVNYDILDTMQSIMITMLR